MSKKWSELTKGYDEGEQAPAMTDATTPEQLRQKHLRKEGSRVHVISYHGGYRNGRWTSWLSCSERRCEVNA